VERVVTKASSSTPGGPPAKNLAVSNFVPGRESWRPVLQAEHICGKRRKLQKSSYAKILEGRVHGEAMPSIKQ